MTDPQVQAELDQYLSSSNQASRTTHPEDRNDPDDLDSDNDSTTLHDDDHPNDADPSTFPNQGALRHYIPKRPRFNANTGPKGVITDAQAFEDAKRLQRQQRQQPLGEKPDGANQLDPISSVAAGQGKYHDASDVDDDDDDDEFLREWRAKRAAELRQPPAMMGPSPSGVSGYYRHPRGSNHTNEPAGGANGTGAKDVTAQEYLDIIEGPDAHVTVLVLIYLEQDYDSHQLKDSFQSLASRYKQQQQREQFITLRSSIAGPMQSLRVPAIIRYRAGEVVGMVQGLDYDDEDELADTLRREGLLS